MFLFVKNFFNRKSACREKTVERQEKSKTMAGPEDHKDSQAITEEEAQLYDRQVWVICMPSTFYMNFFLA